MNWLSWFEKRRVLLVSGILTICLATLVLATLRNTVSYDVFWHLKMGADWVQSGLSPWVDHYSYTFQGQPIANPPVAFQVFLHYAVSALGLFPGFVLVRSVAFLLTLTAVVLLLRQIKSHALIYVIVVPLVIYLLQTRVLVRPELFSYVFSVLALMLYFRAEGRANARTVLPMAFLMLLWTNYHVSVVGYVIFAGFFLDCAVRQVNARAGPDTWARWLGWGMGLLMVGFLNHDLSHPLLEAVNFPQEWKELIREYHPPRPSRPGNQGLYVVMLMAAIVPALATRRRESGILLIWVVMAYAGFTMQRMVIPSGIVIALLLAFLLAKDGFPARWVSTGARTRSYAAYLLLLLAAMALLANVHRTGKVIDENRQSMFRYPEKLVDYMLDNEIKGRIFNDYGIGGYLVYRMSPGSQVYIDGRTQILYPMSHMLRFNSAETTLDVLREERQKYGFGLIISRYYRPLADVFMGLEGFGLDFVDANFALYRSDSPNFPLHGYLLSQPACWRPGMSEGLAAERRLMDRVLPVNSALLPFAEFIAGYSHTIDRLKFIDDSFNEGGWTDQIRRFAAFRIFESGNYNLAGALFAGMEATTGGDYLAAAMAMVMAGEYDLASAVLKDLSDTGLKIGFPQHLRVQQTLDKILAREGQSGPEELELVPALLCPFPESDTKPVQSGS